MTEVVNLNVGTSNSSTLLATFSSKLRWVYIVDDLCVSKHKPVHFMWYASYNTCTLKYTFENMLEFVIFLFLCRGHPIWMWELTIMSIYGKATIIMGLFCQSCNLPQVQICQTWTFHIKEPLLPSSTDARCKFHGGISLCLQLLVHGAHCKGH